MKYFLNWVSRLYDIGRSTYFHIIVQFYHSRKVNYSKLYIDILKYVTELIVLDILGKAGHGHKWPENKYYNSSQI